MTSSLLLSGVVGSHAYGLNREGSDIDRLGVFVAPTLEVAGLDWSSSKETRHGTSDEVDYTYHEIGKAFRLMLSCNPTLLEVLYLEQYETLTQFGRMLITNRAAFLSEKAVRNAYGGYARAQARKLETRGDFGVRTAKHGRHLLRLCRQGRQLLTTGSLSLRVDSPEEFWAFDDMSTGEMLAVYAQEDAFLMGCESLLPVEPDREAVRYLLRTVRAAYVVPDETPA